MGVGGGKVEWGGKWVVVGGGESGKGYVVGGVRGM